MVTIQKYVVRRHFSFQQGSYVTCWFMFCSYLALTFQFATRGKHPLASLEEESAKTWIHCLSEGILAHIW